MLLSEYTLQVLIPTTYIPETSTLYYLTEEGNTVVKKISSRIYSALAHGGDGMTEEQRLNLYDSLEQIGRAHV